MISQCLFAFLVISNMASIWNPMAAAKLFEKTKYLNGTVACALDEPSVVISLEELFQLLSDEELCVAPGALCAAQCLQDPDCTNYNYIKDPMTCELYHYTPTNCSAVTGCTHAEVTDLHSCDIPLADTSTESAVTSMADLNVETTDETNPAVSSTEENVQSDTLEDSTNLPTIATNMGLQETTSAQSNSLSSANSSSVSNPMQSTKSSAMSSTASKAMSTTKSAAVSSAAKSTVKSAAMTSAAKSTAKSAAVSSLKPSTKTVGAASTKAPVLTTKAQAIQTIQPTAIAGAVIIPPPTLASGNPCDKVLSTPNYVVQINQGFGLDETWSAYKYGFSDANGGYWLGNDNMYKMTNNGQKWNVCADVVDKMNIPYHVSYSTFIIDAESTGYTYFASGMTGAPVDLMGGDSRKYKFTTKDMSNQPACTNPSIAGKGGWWWACGGSEKLVLNGVGSSGFKFTVFITIQVKRSYIRISQT